MREELKRWLTGLALAGFLILGVSSEAFSRTFWVQAGAECGGDGSESKPFAALEEARNAARSLAGKEPIEILVKPGTYYLSESFVLEKEDGGTKEASVVYRSLEPKKAHLAGSVKLEGKQFRVTDDPAILARLPESARGKVTEFDLGAAGVEKLDLPGVHCRMPLSVPELFVNGERMRIARWPNEGWATVAKIVDGGSKAGSGNAFDAAKMNEKIETPRGGTFEYSDDAPNRWKAESGVWLWGYWCFD